eukprot:2181989-Alexandrium_andersonii.AAC.1
MCIRDSSPSALTAAPGAPPKKPRLRARHLVSRLTAVILLLLHPLGGLAESESPHGSGAEEQGRARVIPATTLPHSAVARGVARAPEGESASGSSASVGRRSPTRFPEARRTAVVEAA